MLVGQSGTIDSSGCIGWVIAQLKHDGRWLANDMLPCRYFTPASLAARRNSPLEAISPKSVGGFRSSSGFGLYTPRPEYSPVLSTVRSTGRPSRAATVRLLLISAREVA